MKLACKDVGGNLHGIAIVHPNLTQTLIMFLNSVVIVSKFSVLEYESADIGMNGVTLLVFFVKFFFFSVSVTGESR